MTTDIPVLNITPGIDNGVLGDVASGVFERHEFLNNSPGIAIPVLIVLTAACVVGTFGNVLILMSVATTKELQNVESIFIVNLACSDLYVTMVADPMSILGKYTHYI